MASRASGNPALRFEADTLLGHEDDKGVRVMLTPSQVGQDNDPCTMPCPAGNPGLGITPPLCMRSAQALFVVCLADGLDLSTLEAVLAARGKAASVSLESLQQECKLRVAYPLTSSTPPSVRLHLPPTLESLMGAHGTPCAMCAMQPPLSSNLHRLLLVPQGRWICPPGRRGACAPWSMSRRCALEHCDADWYRHGREADVV